MNAIQTVLKELKDHLYLIFRLSLYEMKSQYSMQYLGWFWEIMTPLLQIAVYWVVFGFGIRGGSPVDGIPFVLWLVSGLIAWFFVGSGIPGGTRSIYGRVALVSKMHFPLSTIPAYVILAQFYRHVAMIFLTVILAAAFGYLPGWHTLQLFYIVPAGVIFLYALSLLLSALATMIRDVQNVVTSSIRMLMYLTPIMWVPPDHELFRMLLMINPLVYIVEGYRSAIIGTGFLMEHVWYGVYFWSVVGLILFVGAAVHVRFRRYFIDYV
ncbi:ABC transporter permease [Exiguobacterium flavidum]|uniref:ABC transporter permease n=1 Tax=Exiguobacterium flavidum TaxID=2184695 RepID=UPI000DF73C91|nr:ABC transporter permease [Exiguobacterium flavidum]